MSKTMKIKDLTISRDQIRRARGPKSRAPFFCTFLSCQNPLKAYMGQQKQIAPYGNRGGFDKTEMSGEMVRNFVGPVLDQSGLTK